MSSSTTSASAAPRILAVIQARSGSKGIPDKNIHPILGHPLMAYSIRAGLDSRLVDTVVVSTDSARYAAIARRYGALTPFLRPAELSGDLVPSAPSLRFAVLETEKFLGIVFDYVVELPCVSPLRDGRDIDGALEKLIATGADSVISMVDTGEKHPIRLKRIVDDQIVDFTREYPEPAIGSRRQDLKPPSFIRNGAIYAMTRRVIVEEGSRHGADSRPFIMEPERSINIDERLDFTLAECLLRHGFGNNRPVPVEESTVERVITGGRPVVLVTTPVHFLPEIRQELTDFADVIFAHGASRAEVMRLLPEVDGWICSPCPTYTIDAALLACAQGRLRILATPSTGANHIDLAWCAQHDVAISRLKDSDFVHTIFASSEFTWALIMATVRKLPLAVERVKQGYWRDVEDELRAVEFQGRTLGIIGFGRIGGNVARYAQPFGMRVVAHDPFKTITAPGVTQRATHSEVLAVADIVLIAVHLDASTAGMVDASWFAAMKPGAVFINVSRGEIIDESALLAHLESGHLAAAGLDVITDEFLSDKRRHPLIRYAAAHDHLVITPHIAGLTRDSELKAARYALAAVRDHLPWNSRQGDPRLGGEGDLPPSCKFAAGRGAP
ncbi:MAG: cytidylyltransferase [Magnetococcales bacterium]|nr:cytidylyltransferase [Magnetococcales bacterium]